ncbi:MAG TPA: fumarylacetoacetate hydrolase family protein [Saprospiraceae bacterium]|nr:fumarylacetoacetate hydrolase family protein [Saprospiraceae bacterium]
MKLGTLKSKKNPDGELIVVSQDLQKAVKATSIAPSLREAIENWDEVKPKLETLSQELSSGKLKEAFQINEKDLHSCLPRTWLFADGSAFIHHIKLVRKARNAALPETLETVPLMYQAESGQFLASTDDIPQIDFAHGTDFEAEVGVITDFVPMGTTAEKALEHIKLIVLINDVSLRGLIPAELAQGFGFFQSKPQKALTPFAITPDELGEAYQSGRVHLPLNVKLNNEVFGQPNAKEMHFHFGQLIAHAAKTRNLAAGTLIGSGTVSNENSKLGSGCLVEKRTIEQIEKGSPTTSFMKDGDTVEIWMEDKNGKSIFGRIFQKVKKV